MGLSAMIVLGDVGLERGVSSKTPWLAVGVGGWALWHGFSFQHETLALTPRVNSCLLARIDLWALPSGSSNAKMRDEWLPGL